MVNPGIHIFKEWIRSRIAALELTSQCISAEFGSLEAVDREIEMRPVNMSGAIATAGGEGDITKINSRMVKTEEGRKTLNCA